MRFSFSLSHFLLVGAFVNIPASVLSLTLHETQQFAVACGTSGGNKHCTTTTPAFSQSCSSITLDSLETLNTAFTGSGNTGAYYTLSCAPNQVQFCKSQVTAGGCGYQSCSVPNGPLTVATSAQSVTCNYLLSGFNDASPYNCGSNWVNLRVNFTCAYTVAAPTKSPSAPPTRAPIVTTQYGSVACPLTIPDASGVFDLTSTEIDGGAKFVVLSGMDTSVSSENGLMEFVLDPHRPSCTVSRGGASISQQGSTPVMATPGKSVAIASPGTMNSGYTIAIGSSGGGDQGTFTAFRTAGSSSVISQWFSGRSGPVAYTELMYYAKPPTSSPTKMLIVHSVEQTGINEILTLIWSTMTSAAYNGGNRQEAQLSGSGISGIETVCCDSSNQFIAIKRSGTQFSAGVYTATINTSPTFVRTIQPVSGVYMSDCSTQFGVNKWISFCSYRLDGSQSGSVVLGRFTYTSTVTTPTSLANVGSNKLHSSTSYAAGTTVSVDTCVVTRQPAFVLAVAYTVKIGAVSRVYHTLTDETGTLLNPNAPPVLLMESSVSEYRSPQAVCINSTVFAVSYGEYSGGATTVRSHMLVLGSRGSGGPTGITTSTTQSATGGGLSTTQGGSSSVTSSGGSNVQTGSAPPMKTANIVVIVLGALLLLGCIGAYCYRENMKDGRRTSSIGLLNAENQNQDWGTYKPPLDALRGDAKPALPEAEEQRILSPKEKEDIAFSDSLHAITMNETAILEDMTPENTDEGDGSTQAGEAETPMIILPDGEFSEWVCENDHKNSGEAYFCSLCGEKRKDVDLRDVRYTQVEGFGR